MSLRYISTQVPIILGPHDARINFIYNTFEPHSRGIIPSDKGKKLFKVKQAPGSGSDTDNYMRHSYYVTDITYKKLEEISCANKQYCGNHATFVCDKCFHCYYCSPQCQQAVEATHNEFCEQLKKFTPQTFLIKEVTLFHNGHYTRETDSRFFYGWISFDEMATVSSHTLSYVRTYDRP